MSEQRANRDCNHYGFEGGVGRVQGRVKLEHILPPGISRVEGVLVVKSQIWARGVNVSELVAL